MFLLFLGNQWKKPWGRYHRKAIKSIIGCIFFGRGGLSHQLPQSVYFFCLQPAPPARRQLPQFDWAERNPFELQDGVPDLLAHSMDLVVLPLADLNQEPRVLRALSYDRGLASRHLFAFVLYPLTKKPQTERPGDSLYLRLIALGHVKPRVKQGLGQRAVIGEEQEALRVKIQSSHRIEAGKSLGKQI